jgi:threonine/homoserine/homoserine lactone efflux protein
MDAHSILAFTLVAAIAIASPGPATLMAINNSLAHGQRSAVWSSVGNASGLFCLSAAAMLGLGALLASSEWLFNAVKILGAGYLFYLGAKAVVEEKPDVGDGLEEGAKKASPTPGKLYKSAFLTAVTNPKATMFFTALFPQFIDQGAALLPQFLILTTHLHGVVAGVAEPVCRARHPGQGRADPAGAVALGEPSGGDDLHWFWRGDLDHAPAGGEGSVTSGHGRRHRLTPSSVAKEMSFAVSRKSLM